MSKKAKATPEFVLIDGDTYEKVSNPAERKTTIAEKAEKLVKIILGTVIVSCFISVAVSIYFGGNGATTSSYTPTPKTYTNTTVGGTHEVTKAEHDELMKAKKDSINTVRNSMTNPGSFSLKKGVECWYSLTSINCHVTFTGTNAFGGTVQQKVRVKHENGRSFIAQ